MAGVGTGPPLSSGRRSASSSEQRNIRQVRAPTPGRRQIRGPMYEVAATTSSNQRRFSRTSFGLMYPPMFR